MSEEGIDLRAIEAAVDKFYAEVERHSKDIREETNISRQDLWAYSEKWDGIFGRASVVRSRIQRKYWDAKAQYDDNMRKSMTSGGRSLGDSKAWNERLAEYETRNLSHFVELRKWQRALEEYDSLIKYLTKKDFWLTAKMKTLVRDEVREENLSSKNFHIND